MDAVAVIRTHDSDLTDRPSPEVRIIIRQQLPHFLDVSAPEDQTDGSRRVSVEAIPIVPSDELMEIQTEASE